LSAPQNRHFVLHNSLNNIVQNNLNEHIFLKMNCYQTQRFNNLGTSYKEEKEIPAQGTTFTQGSKHNTRMWHGRVNSFWRQSFVVTPRKVVSF